MVALKSRREDAVNCTAEYSYNDLKLGRVHRLDSAIPGG
jgi:hypothetical protein